MHAELFDPADLFDTIDAAFAHYERAGGHERRQTLGRCQVDCEGFEIAIIDADQLRARGDGARQFFLRVHLDQRIQRQGGCLPAELAQQGWVEQGRDKQHGVGAVALRLDNLVGVEHEILAQQRHADGVVNFFEISQTTLKKPLLG